jgi:hypothetical protein
MRTVLLLCVDAQVVALTFHCFLEVLPRFAVGRGRHDKD